MQQFLLTAEITAMTDWREPTVVIHVLQIYCCLTWRSNCNKKCCSGVKKYGQ